MNYVLVDYENVQPNDLAALGGQAFKVIVFVGSKQKLPVKFVRALQPLGSDAEYIQISGNGSNALDFHIAFTIGELSKSHPGAVFNIISKDAGFDPLIEYLKTKDIVARRFTELNVPSRKIPDANPDEDKVAVIVRNLASRKEGRPVKVKTLSNTINALFSKSLKEAELAALVQALVKRGYVVIKGSDVISYHLPGKHKQAIAAHG